jgi:MOSC domain-containing protein YiiM
MVATQENAFDGSVADVQAAPRDGGRLEWIVRRPAVDEREIVQDAELDPEVGLVGDSWLARGNRGTADGSADTDNQITLVNVRVLRAIEPDPDRWPLAGDQLYVDLDLSIEALPVGSRLAIGTAVLEVTDKPHTGCAKYSARFGSEALRWINSPVGRAHRMRGMNTRIVVGGTVRTGDVINRV